MSPHIRKNDAGVATDNSRIAHVEKLASDHDTVPAWLGLHLNIDLKGVRAIEHLPRADTCRSSSFENGLQKTVEENLDAAARSLSLTCQPDSCEGCLGDSDRVLRRLVNRFRSRGLPNSLPQRNCFRTAFAALFQVLLHQILLAGVNSPIHKIDPMLRCKMFPFCPPTLPGRRDDVTPSGHKGRQKPRKYKNLKGHVSLTESVSLPTRTKGAQK